MKRIAFAITTLASPATAFAMTGAELMQADRNFASGYVLGVVDTRINVLDVNNPDFYRVRNCVIGSKMTAETLLTVTIEWLKRNPKELPNPALGGVMGVIREMCPTSN